MSDRPIAHTIYKHFKGNLYQVICVATDSENGQEMVVYQALYGDYKFYVRPLEMFMSKVDKEKYPDVKQEYRFEKVEINTDVSAKSSAASVTSNVAEAEIDSNSISTKTNVTSELETVDNTTQSKPKLDSDLLAFFDASTYEERLEILARMRYKITDDMIDSMSIVTSIDVPAGDVAKRYEDFKEALMTRKHFECSRFRRGGL